ncbi:MAG: hypothetical protein WBE18_02725 [Gammaproteobacteria bacterium]
MNEEETVAVPSSTATELKAFDLDGEDGAALAALQAAMNVAVKNPHDITQTKNSVSNSVSFQVIGNEKFLMNLKGSVINLKNNVKIELDKLIVALDGLKKLSWVEKKTVTELRSSLSAQEKILEKEPTSELDEYLKIIEKVYNNINNSFAYSINKLPDYSNVLIKFLADLAKTFNIQFLKDYTNNHINKHPKTFLYEQKATFWNSESNKSGSNSSSQQKSPKPTSFRPGN